MASAKGITSAAAQHASKANFRPASQSLCLQMCIIYKKQPATSCNAEPHHTDVLAVGGYCSSSQPCTWWSHQVPREFALNKDAAQLPG